jgi:hypothetical protein
MTVPTLSPGSQLTFVFTATTTATDRGAIVNTVQVSAAGDPNPSNNSATWTTTAVDANNGSYSVFGANGLAYSLSIDFDAGTYTMAGNGTSVPHPFALDAASGDYVASGYTGAGSVRFRVAQDLIVGGHDFTTGVVQPYVAARNFVTSLSQAGGPYDLATRTVSGTSAVTQVGTALIQDGALAICQSTTGVATVNNCSGTKTTYNVTGPTNNLFMGTNPVDNTVYTFALANSGNVQLLLSATGGQFRLGLPDSSALSIGGTLHGSSTTGDWLTMTLTPTAYAFTVPGSTVGDSANLFPVNGNAGPNSLFQGLLLSNDNQMYVMQAGSLGVAIGTVTPNGANIGLLQLTLLLPP